jgi:hypothetical protein
MAIINTYPSATPKGADLLIGTQVKDDTVEENSTKSFTVDSLGSYIVTSTSGITGSGTVNTIAMFTPSTSTVGDSFITQEANNIKDAFDSNGGISTGTNVLTVQNIFGQLQWEDSTDLVSGSIAKLIPFQITASAGGSSTYSADNNIVEISWTGGNGTYVLNIPSATAIPYRNIRFVTNSTFPNGASDKVQITAQSGETIDGAAFFEISKVYEGVSVWSNGTEWIIIQAKAH